MLSPNDLIQTILVLQKADGSSENSELYKKYLTMLWASNGQDFKLTWPNDPNIPKTLNPKDGNFSQSKVIVTTQIVNLKTDKNFWLLVPTFLLLELANPDQLEGLKPMTTQQTDKLKEVDKQSTKWLEENGFGAWKHLIAYHFVDGSLEEGQPQFCLTLYVTTEASTIGVLLKTPIYAQRPMVRPLHREAGKTFTLGHTQKVEGVAGTNRDTVIKQLDTNWSSTQKQNYRKVEFHDLVEPLVQIYYGSNSFWTPGLTKAVIENLGSEDTPIWVAHWGWIDQEKGRVYTEPEWNDPDAPNLRWSVYNTLNLIASSPKQKTNHVSIKWDTIKGIYFLTPSDLISTDSPEIFRCFGDLVADLHSDARIVIIPNYTGNGGWELPNYRSNLTTFWVRVTNEISPSVTGDFSLHAITENQYQFTVEISTLFAEISELLASKSELKIALPGGVNYVGENPFSHSLSIDTWESILTDFERLYPMSFDNYKKNLTKEMAQQYVVI